MKIAVEMTDRCGNARARKSPDNVDIDVKARLTRENLEERKYYVPAATAACSVVAEARRAPNAYYNIYLRVHRHFIILRRAREFLIVEYT